MSTRLAGYTDVVFGPVRGGPDRSLVEQYEQMVRPERM